MSLLLVSGMDARGIRGAGLRAPVPTSLVGALALERVVSGTLGGMYVLATDEPDATGRAAWCLCFSCSATVHEEGEFGRTSG